MKAETKILRESLYSLAHEREVSESLWSMVVDVVVQQRRQAETQGHSVGGAAEDDAGDFLVFLADRSPSALGAINSKSALIREYKKWLVHTSSPVTKELWEIISAALLKLEREGTVVRAAEFRTFNNSNKTRWARDEKEGRDGRLLTSEEVESVKPTLAAKSDKRRILNPDEARQWLLGLLDLAGGEVAMQDLFHAVKSVLPLFSVVQGEDLSLEDDEGNAEGISWQDRFCAAQITPDLEARIEEDIESAVSRVWASAGEIQRGSDPVVEGARILCCYWLPKNVYGQKVTLQDFGHTSTVKDVATDLSRMMARHVPFPNHVEPDSSDRLACLRVAAGIIDGLASRCSENGYCRRF